MGYIPNKDADLINWGQNFSDLITANPATYGLQASDALSIQTQYDEFYDAYVLAVNPATRTTTTILAKDEQRAGFLNIARLYAAIIRANSGVTPEDKVALGLTVPDPTPTPIPTPSTTPLLAVPLFGVGIQQMTVVDSATPLIKKKPFGAAGALLEVVNYTGTFPATPVWSLMALLTKSDNVITTSGLFATGSTNRYRARWYTAKGLFGPISPTIDVIVT